MLLRNYTQRQYVRWQLKWNVTIFGGMFLLAWGTAKVNRMGGWPKRLLDEVGVALSLTWSVVSFWFFVVLIVTTIYLVARGGLVMDSRYWRKVDNAERRGYHPQSQPSTKEAPNDG